MDASSRSQGRRIFVAVGASVALAGLDTQAARVVNRRNPWLLKEPAAVRRYRIVSPSALGACVLCLFAAALFLP